MIASVSVSRATVQDVLKECAQDPHDLQDRMEEYQQEVRHYIRRLTHEQSSAVSVCDYQRVCKALDYLLAHTVYQKERTLKWNLYQGLLQIQKDMEKIADDMKKCSEMGFLFRFSELRDLFEQDLPLIRSHWHQENAWLEYGTTPVDITVPLIDGLPVFHDMYGAVGTDFVRYYLERFYIEMSYCRLFAHEIEVFCEHYHSVRKVRLERLNLNLCELFFQHAFARYLLSKCTSILLKFEDVVRLKHILPTIDLPKAFRSYIDRLDVDVAAYFSLFQEVLLNHYAERVDALVFQKEEQVQEVWHIQEYGQGNTQDALERSLCLAPEQIPQQIRQLELGVYDVFDLLDQLCFDEEEFQRLFRAFGTANCNVFAHCLLQLYDVSTLSAVSDEKEWIDALCAFFRSAGRTSRAG